MGLAGSRAMITATKPRAETHGLHDTGRPRTLIGWQGIRFTLPPEWNLTGFSNEAGGGYVKLDSPGTMFAQVKWMEPGGSPRKDLVGILLRLLRSLKVLPPAKARKPNLKAVLEAFLADTGRSA